MAPEIHAAALKDLARRTGLPDAAAADVRELAACLDRADWFPRPQPGTAVLLPALAPHLPAAGDGAFLVCARPFPAGDKGVPGPGRAAVAAFARADYYRSLVKALRQTARLVTERTGLPKSACRVFVNSRIPEKLIACASGLGDYGRNRLIYTPRLGSRCVIGLLFLECRLSGSGDERVPLRPGAICGTCTACVDACPTAALGPDAAPGLPACLKTRSDTLDVWDEETKRAWGGRLYGCDTCQDVCPKNAALPAAPAAAEGALGPEIDIAFLLSLSDEECRRYFKKTALGRTWIRPELLKRNALCAAGNSGSRILLAAVRRYLADPRPALADMAAWAERRLE